ncbi:hypothetical protein [Rubritalea halochordaticola]
MKTRILLTVLLMFSFVVPLEAVGINRGGKSSKGGHASRQASKPKPSNKGHYRPQTRPASKPASRPSKPAARPAPKPSKPSARPATRPSAKPATRPSAKPSPKPSTRPAGKPATKPSTRPDKKPDKPDIGNRPDKPTTRPGKVPDKKPGKPDRPDIGGRPDRPDVGDRPSRPGFGGGNKVPEPPGKKPRPPRPEWDKPHKDKDHKYTKDTVNWMSHNRDTVNKFDRDRDRRWKDIDDHWRDRDWHKHWGDRDYRDWRRDMWHYRGDRCREVWYHNRHHHYHDHFFNVHWWGSCYWYPRPIVYHHCSPWWWWRPVVWGTMGYFFGQALSPDPIIYDPGTTVVYEGDTIYINGESAGNADEYRRETIALANPELEETPMPGPPELAEDASEEEIAAANDSEKPTGDWLPVGVWALTQQEQGDATMFLQLSIDKEGVVAGAYKNVMTGDEQPVAGQVDFKSQRVAWHVGEATQTVYETGLSNLENDVASVFVHFGESQTQTWLLVRMPSPEMPGETVKLPEVTDK